MVVGEKIAEVAISTSVQTLTKFISEEATLLKGVSEKVVQLRDELRWMQSFLKSADTKQEGDAVFHEWVSQIRDVANDAEDVIGTYSTRAASQCSWNVVAKLINLHKVGKKIEKIRAQAQNISSQKERFGIVTGVRTEEGGGSANSAKSSKERLRWWRQTTPSLVEDDLVGLVEDTTQLLTQLSSTYQRRSVISIVGMGGLGKTTLAKKLYNHEDTKKTFECKAFVYVSKEYSRRDTLSKIIKDISPHDIDELKKQEEEELVLKLHGLLKEKRYLVVLDDIWEKEVWDSLRAAFPDGKEGSKVMLTTRNREVALHADARNIPHEPRFLTDEESLELLHKKAIPEMEHVPSDLEKLGAEMVTKCGGLPLAVVVLGGLLSTKSKTAEEWKRVLQNISWRLIDQDRVSAVLALSYNDLSFHLKSCFLHLGLFPEDFSIPKTKVMRMWAAEGFLPEQGEEMPEVVAENCLDELIDRCMVQVGNKTSFGRVKTIRIHDLLRDLCVRKGKEENFFRIYSENKAESGAFQSTKSRRLAIHGRTDQYAFLEPYGPYLRSLLFLNNESLLNLDFIFKNFKLLRVLDGVRMDMPPGSISTLTQLRYLELMVRKGKVPKSIKNLKNLQTLKLSTDSEAIIPDVIWKLEHLRHLTLNGTGKNLRLDTLSHLQTLKGIQAGMWIDGSLDSMTNLRRLFIQDLTGDLVDEVISTVGESLQCLQSLSLKLLTGESFPTSAMEQLCDCEKLEKLCLSGRIEKLPFLPDDFAPNLVKLSLIDSHLNQDSIDDLSYLPNLKMLFLGSKAYEHKELYISGFPQLELLHLHSLPYLEELDLDAAVRRKMKKLEIRKCYRFERIFHGSKEWSFYSPVESFSFEWRSEDDVIINITT